MQPDAGYADFVQLVRMAPKNAVLCSEALHGHLSCTRVWASRFPACTVLIVVYHPEMDRGSDIACCLRVGKATFWIRSRTGVLLAGAQSQQLTQEWHEHR